MEEERGVRNMIKKEIPYYLVIVIAYILVPLLMTDTGSAMFLLLFVLPLTIYITAFVYGLKHGFHLRFALITALLFIPSIFLHYNESAWIYTFIFGALALAGNAFALLYRKK